MNILHICVYPPQNERHSPFVSGVDLYEKNLVTNIPNTDADTTYVLCNKLSEGYTQYNENNVEIVRCFDSNPKFIFQILKEVIRIRPDIIHIQQELALYGNVITAWLLQWLVLVLRVYCPVVMTLHGVVSIRKIDRHFVRDNNSNLPVLLIKIAFRVIYTPPCWFSNRIIVHEEIFRNILVAEYKIRADKISIVHHGVEDFQAGDHNESLRKLAIAETCDVVLFMGYLTGYKGLDILIEGFSKYTRKNRKAFLILGAGKHPKLETDKTYLKRYQQYVDKAKALIPDSQYRWVGFIPEDEVGVYCSAGDVSVYPYTISISSSGPLAIAVAYEKPFLASRAFEEIVQDKSVLFENTPQGLCEKLEEFFNNKSKFAENLSQFKRERLWANIGKQTRALYSEISRRQAD